MHVQSQSPVQLFATPQNAAHRSSVHGIFFRQDYWCRLPFPYPVNQYQCIIKSRLYSDSFVVVQLPSHVRLFETPWTAACQASLSFFAFHNFFFSPVPGFCSRYGIIFSHHVTFLAMIFSQTSLVFDNLGSTGELQA